MIIVGITGGIGSGKSTVSTYFEKRYNATVIQADSLAKNLMVSDSELVSKIKQHFGEEAYLSDGSLNKTYLSHQAFVLGKVELLNSIVHPAVYRYFEQQIEKERKKGTKVLIREAALLLQKGRPEGFDSIVLVTANPEIRIQRVMERDHVTEQQVRERMAKQQSDEEMLHYADYVVENNGNQDKLYEKLDLIYLQWI